MSGLDGLDDAGRRRLRHDLRTPLTIVAGFAEVLATDREISLADRRDYAERIHGAALELMDVLDALLDGPGGEGGGGDGPQAA